MAGLGLGCCVRAFSRCGERWLLFVVVGGILIMVASHCGAQALECTGISSCGAWALLSHSMWGLPGPGIEPMCPA